MDSPYSIVLLGDNYVVFSLEEENGIKCDNRKQCHAVNAKGKEKEHAFTKPTHYPPHTSALINV